MRASIRRLTPRPLRASHGELHHARPRVPGCCPTTQRRLEDVVEAENAPRAREGEAEERQRLQRPDPVPLARHVEGAEGDVHLPEEAGDASEAGEGADEQSRAE